MITEITDNAAYKGVVLYDAHCRVCAGLATRCEALLAARGFAMAPLQTHGRPARRQPNAEERFDEMVLLTADGRCFGGADALVVLARGYWWALPLAWLARLPGVLPLLRFGYAWVARHRHCAGGACRVDRRRQALRANPPTIARGCVPWLPSWLPLLVLLGLALLSRPGIAPWGFMWVMAFALFAGLKWLTCEAGLLREPAASWQRRTGYLLAWPGMDAQAFFATTATVPRPRMREWLFAWLKLAFGIALIGCGVPLALPHGDLLAGWLGMIGLIFCLHFGAFHLLSLAWRRAGVNAAPLMRAPVAATSLAEFWGARWNTGFSIPARRHLLGPWTRRWGLKRATLGVFLFSGLLHEWVISLPANAGWGLPTLYFVVQAWGLAFERSALGRRWGLGAQRPGRIFALTVAAVPAFWLFHPAFVHRVILPMLQALGAT